jgi:uncharacterized DUF497 family protein
MTISFNYANLSFEWDSGNSLKNRVKHHVESSEAEDIFFNNPLVLEDIIHSTREQRFWALGETGADRFLHVTFTVRKDKIRVISARSMSKKERKIYEKIKKTT